MSGGGESCVDQKGSGVADSGVKGPEQGAEMGLKPGTPRLPLRPERGSRLARNTVQSPASAPLAPGDAVGQPKPLSPRRRGTWRERGARTECAF